MGVNGKVRDGDNHDSPPLAGVTVMVTGDEDGLRGPYYSTTDSDGNYGLVIAEFGLVPERVEFRAEIFGADVKSDNRPTWSVINDCHAGNANQVMEIKWEKD